MRYVPYCLPIALIVIWSTTGLAAESESPKEESAEAAERMLLKARDKAGDLIRFEAEFYISEVDHPFSEEKRGRGRIYFEAAGDACIERHTIDISRMTSRHRSRDGMQYTLEEIRPETWMWKNGELTWVDDEHRTYAIHTEQPRCNSLGYWSGSWFSPFVTPRICIPLWLDPEVEWEYLKSQYKFVDAKSTPGEFAFRLVRRDPDQRADWCDGSRFEWDYSIVLDRRTCLPKKYTIMTTTGTSEQTYIYTRFDINPPHHELHVDLTGYKDSRTQSSQTHDKDARTLPTQSTSNGKESQQTDGTFLLCLRLLAWYFF